MTKIIFPWDLTNAASLPYTEAMITREDAEALSMFVETNPITDEDREWLFSQILDQEERDREEAWAEYLEGTWVDPFEMMWEV